MQATNGFEQLQVVTTSQMPSEPNMFFGAPFPARHLHARCGSAQCAGSRNIVRLAASFKFKLRATPDGRPTPTGTQEVKVVASSNSLLAALSTSNAEKEFAEGLQQLVSRAGHSGAIPASASLPAVDRSSLRTLETMGFDATRATCALLACDDNFNRAIQWLTDNEGQPTDVLVQQLGGAVQPADGGVPDAPARVAGPLLTMGYSREDAAAAFAATQSSNISRCVDWLLSNPQRGSGVRCSGTQSQAAASGFYPDVNFAAPAAQPGAVQSHPVGDFDDSPNTLYGSHTPGYDADDASKQYYAGAAGSAPRQPRYHGMGALIHRKQEEAQQIGHEVHTGFRDLETLRASGERLAALAADLRERVAQRHAGDATLDTRMADSLVDLGIVDPVTKRNAGTRYQEQLARQLATFLEPVLRKESGMMALHDVYCVFNRARGLELVSPDDLRSAVEQFERLRLPVRFRQFPSGVAVVQDESWSDDAACEHIIMLLSAPAPRTDDAPDAEGPAEHAGAASAEGLGRGLRPTQFAIEANVPVAVATEQLLLAERVGVVCRDDAAGGLTFYRNFFMSVPVPHTA